MQVGSAGETIIVNKSANRIIKVVVSIISSFSPSKRRGSVTKYPMMPKTRKTPMNFKESEKNEKSLSFGYKILRINFPFLLRL